MNIVADFLKPSINKIGICLLIFLALPFPLLSVPFACPAALGVSCGPKIEYTPLYTYIAVKIISFDRYSFDQLIIPIGSQDTVQYFILALIISYLLASATTRI